MTVLHTLGVEGETELPLAALVELLRPLRTSVDALSPAHRSVVSALLDGGDAAVDRFTLGAATLALLALAAEDAPLLVVVDDAHWLDDLSGAVLSFALRRLGADAVAVVLGRRPDAGRPVAGPWQELRLAGLGPADAREVLGMAAAPVAAALHAATGGNPLALGELRRVLSAAQLAGRVPLPDPLPLGRRGTAAFGWRFAGLPVATRRALTVVAAAGAGGSDLLGAALADLGLTAADLEPAERAGLVVLGAGEVTFVHPLVRAAAFATATPATRRQAHRALADASADGTTGEDVQRHALHLTAATAVPSENVAVACERAADEAERRGGPAAGAAARIGAAALSPAGPARDVRRVRAAEACLVAGRRDDAHRLVGEVLAAGAGNGVRARALAVRASLAVWSIGVVDAVPDLWSIFDELADTAADLAALVAIQLTIVLAGVGRLGDSLELTGRARGLPITDPVIAYLLEYRHALASVWNGEDGALEDAERRFPSHHYAAEARRRFPHHDQTMVQMWTLAERYDDARAAADEHVAAARRSSAPASLPMPLMMRGDLLLRTGDLTRARADLEEAVELGLQVGYGGLVGYGHALVARAAAIQGDARTAERHADESLAASRRAGQWPVELYRSHALGLLELGRGDPAAAAGHLDGNARSRGAAGPANAGALPWQGDYVEALHGAGRTADAAAALADLDADAKRCDSRWARSVAGRCRALLGADDWPALYEAALDEQDDLPFERDRTLLQYGARLRRDRRITAARDVLAAAADGLTLIGAAPWAARARAELQAAGGRSPGTTHLAPTLTAQELRVCLAVGDGATNREVAAALFLSPRTVEYHLGRAFAKLGVDNRGQLARLVADGGLR